MAEVMVIAQGDDDELDHALNCDPTKRVCDHMREWAKLGCPCCGNPPSQCPFGGE